MTKKEISSPHSAPSSVQFVEFFTRRPQERQDLLMHGFEPVHVLDGWASRRLEADQANSFKALEDPAQGGAIGRLFEVVGDGLASGGELLA